MVNCNMSPSDILHFHRDEIEYLANAVFYPESIYCFKCMFVYKCIVKLFYVKN